MNNYAEERQIMVNEQLIPRGITDDKVLEAFSRVPRHRFVPVEQRHAAYSDQPLTIGHGQTISQPYIVALMTQSLSLEKGDRVLEIGTGSGYQAAILAEIAGEVYTVERIPELASRAQELLKELDYTNIRIKVSDGTVGWPEHSPYQGILVTAASPKLPNTLLEQLAIQGRMVIPVGQIDFQELLLITKTEEGHQESNLGDCRFVPLKGQEGWSHH